MTKIKKKAGSNGTKRRWRGGVPIAVHVGTAELRVLAHADGFRVDEWSGRAGVSTSTVRQWLDDFSRVPGPVAWENLEPILEALRREEGSPYRHLTHQEILGAVPHSLRDEASAHLEMTRSCGPGSASEDETAGDPEMDALLETVGVKTAARDRARELCRCGHVREDHALDATDDGCDTARCECLLFSFDANQTARPHDDGPELETQEVASWPPFSEHVLEFAPELEDCWRDGEFHLNPQALWAVIRRAGVGVETQAIARRRS